MRGILIKTNMERIRLATDTEWLGAELIKVLSDDAKIRIEKGPQRGYVDASNEPGPNDDVDPESPTPADGDTVMGDSAEGRMPPIPENEPFNPEYVPTSPRPEPEPASLAPSTVADENPGASETTSSTSSSHFSMI